jgi:RecJ-like exonuclease
LINSLFQDIEKEFDKIGIAAKKYVKIKKYGKFKLLRINRSKVGDWEYPSSKLIRITHDLVNGPHITFSETENSISYRADHVKFSGVNLIEVLKKKVPHALVSGGGHDQAGNIRYNAASKEEVLKNILDYLEKL